MTTDDLRLRTTRAILAAMPIVLRTVGCSTREAGIVASHPQTRLMAMLAACPRTLTEIATAHGVTPATATTLVTTLENRGWVHRERDDADRRRVDVRLTESGYTVLAEAQAVAERAIAELLEQLDEARCAELLAGVEILRSLGAPKPDPHA